MTDNFCQTAVEIPAAPQTGDVRVAARPAVTGVAVVAVMIVAAYVITGALLIRGHEFWSPDSSVRFVQTESLRRAGYRSVTVPYPAEVLDPEGRYFPAGPWFHFMRDGRHYLSYLPYFPAVSGVLYGAFGFPGLIMLPMAAGLLAVWITYRFLTKHGQATALWGSVALALGTPVVIYSGVFWDHSIAVAFAAGALALVADAVDAPHPRFARLVAAGALLGGGTWLRNEMYLLAAVAVGLWPLTSHRRRIAGSLALGAGAGVVVGAQWLVNSHLYGSGMGYKGQGLVAGRLSDAVEAGGNRLVPWITDKLGNLYYQVFSPDFYAFNATAVAIGLGIGLALLLAGLVVRLGVARHARSLVTAGGALAALTVILMISSRSAVSGLLPAAPFLVIMLVNGPRRSWEVYLRRVSSLFVAAVVLTGTHGGLQWGPRYLLPVLPALVWLTAAAVGRVSVMAPRLWQTMRLSAGMVVGAAMLVQAAGVEFVEFSIARNARVNEALREAPADIVVTSLEWLVLGAGPIYFEKRLMYVDNIEDFERLVDRLAERRVTRWSYIPRSGGAFRHQQVAEWTNHGAWRFRVLQDTLINGIRVTTYSGSAAQR